MKVAIDISPLKSSHRFRGIGAYTKNLVKSLQSLKKRDFELVLIEKDKIPQNCDLIHFPYFDLFFTTLPLIRKKKTIVTIHDTTPLVFPKHYPPGIKGKLRFQVQKMALKTVDGVITDSKNSQKDISLYLDYPKEKIFVVYLAAADIFRKERKKLEKVREKYRLPQKFILYVGDVNYNKNILGLVKACKLVKTPLVIVGKQAVEKKIDRSHPENRDLVWLQDYCKSSIINHKSSIILTGFVPDKDLVIIYNLATVYCQPSFYEGFGLPVLEAMACGTPVVTSKKASLPEITRKAAVLVDPYDINDIANGLTVAIEDEDLREDLIEKGLKQVKNFSWEKVANETYKVYQKVVAKK